MKVLHGNFTIIHIHKTSSQNHSMSLTVLYHNQALTDDVNMVV